MNESRVPVVLSPVPPSIADSASQYSVSQGSSVRLVCDVEGDPEPEITWTKNGLPIADTNPHYFQDGSGSLEVLSADRHDTATYACTAVNVAGLREKRIRLFVHGLFPIILVTYFTREPGWWFGLAVTRWS